MTTIIKTFKLYSMKTKILICLLFLNILCVNAQQKCNTNRQNRIEVFKQKKAEFLKKELQLTDAEFKSFIPLVNELMDKKYEVNRSSRQYMKTISYKKVNSDTDYKTAINAMLNSQLQEAQLQKEYSQKFLEVLPAEKVYKYYQVEMKFMRNMLDKKNAEYHRNGNKSSSQPK